MGVSDSKVTGGRMTRRGVLGLAATAGVAVAAAPLLAACQSAVSTPTVTVPPGPKTLRWGTLKGITRLDPHFSIQDDNIFYQVADKMTHANPDGSFSKEIGLATEWKNLDDKTWQFKLRQGVKWHNGDPFTAADIKFSLERAVDPKLKSLVTGSLAPLQRVEIVDDYTVNLITSAVDALLPGRLNFYGGFIMPAKYYREAGGDAYERKPIGTGPFRFISGSRDAVVILEANKDHYAGAPAIDGIEMRTIPEDTARMVALLDTREINFAPDLVSDQYAKVRANPQTKVIETDYPAITCLHFNQRVKPLENKFIRQALSLSIDRASLNKNLFADSQKIPNGMIPPTDFAYDKTLPPMAFDPEKAKSLLKQGNYQGQPIILESTAGQIFFNDPLTSQAIVNMWKEAGINAQLGLFDAATRQETRSKGTFKGVVSVTTNSGNTRDPDQIMWRSLGLRDVYGWEGPGRDEFMKLGNATYTLDQAVRLKNFQRMNQIVLDEMVAIPIFVPGIAIGVARYVQHSAGPAVTLNMRASNMRFGS